MSKFQRVAETQTLPSHIEQAFFPEPPAEDPYASLREGQVERRVHIARTQLEMSRNAESPEPVYDERWAVSANQATHYGDRRLAPADASLSNLMPEDLSGRAVRRAAYDTDDEELTMRGPKEFYVTALDAVDLVNRGASIWNPDMDVIAEGFQQSQTQNFFRSADERERETAKRQAEWETTKMDGIMRQRRKITSRANPMLLSRAGQTVTRTGIENVTDGRFGLQDYAAIEQHEIDRKERLEEQRSAKLAIKATDHKVREQRHEEWEENVRSAANTYQSQDNNWMNSHLDDMMADAVAAENRGR